MKPTGCVAQRRRLLQSMTLVDVVQPAVQPHNLQDPVCGLITAEGSFVPPLHTNLPT